MTRFDTIFEQRQLAHATTIENVAHVWVQAQTSHRWQMEAYEPTSDRITAISNAVGLANPTIVSNSKRQLLAVTLSGPMSTGYDPMSLQRATHREVQKVAGALNHAPITPVVPIPPR